MELTLISSGRYSQRKVERDHYWYDHKARKMLYGRGGRMEFRYDAASKKTVPVLVDEFEKVYETNYRDIIDWVTRKQEEYNLELIGHSGNKAVRVSAPALQLKPILDDLQRSGILSEWDQSEYRKEMREAQKVIEDHNETVKSASSRQLTDAGSRTYGG
jgi:hypothetical protein